MAAVSARGIGAALGVLVAAAAFAAADLARPQGPGAAAFHRITGGLGTGPGLDFAGCGASFDARVEDVCEDLVGPIPGCGSLCPDHGYHDRLIR